MEMSEKSVTVLMHNHTGGEATLSLLAQLRGVLVNADPRALTEALTELGLNERDLRGLALRKCVQCVEEDVSAFATGSPGFQVMTLATYRNHLEVVMGWWRELGGKHDNQNADALRKHIARFNLLLPEGTCPLPLPGIAQEPAAA